MPGPGERYCLGHLFVAKPRAMTRAQIVSRYGWGAVFPTAQPFDASFLGWPRRFRVIGRTR